MARRAFVVGSRGSLLARRQTELALDALRRAHPDARFQLRTVTTSGDRSQASLAEIGGRGVFVVELERALLGGQIDVAVHSLKDMPSGSTEGLTVAAVSERADVRDVLVSRDGLTLAALPAGAVVGTGSPRRAAQLLAARPDLRVADIRGNVDSRIRKVEDGDYDATVLAAAGLARLGWLDRASEILPAEVMLPAVGQGALALQVRAADAEAAALVAAVGHAPTERATAAERAFEARLGGGCHSAIAALGEVVGPLALSLSKGEAPNDDGSRLRLRGLVADPGGGRLLRDEIEGSVEDAEALGVRLAEALLAQGASAILEAAS
ncbi:MAG: hydroxymethylbilane synthase [Dehalococcoidia bacterium]|nr:hydroxymethylbilane synthase [Dehalococcoidia bacterium]